MQTSSFVNKLSGISSQLDQFQFALSGALSNDDKKQLSKMALQLRCEWNQHVNDVNHLLDATTNLDTSKAVDGLDVLGSVTAGLRTSIPTDEAQVDNEIAKLEPFEDQAKNLLDELSRLRETRRRFKTNLISGDWDSPLAKVLHEAKDHFLFDIEDFMGLAFTSKSVREALRDVPVNANGLYDWKIEDDRSVCSLPPLVSQVRPLIVHADIKHRYEGRSKKLKLFLPTQHMKKLDRFCFSLSGAGMYDIAMSNSLFPKNLTTLTLTAEFACGLFTRNGNMTLLCQPNIPFADVCPGLLTLDLSHLNLVTTDQNPFVCPPRLKKLVLRHVKGINKVKFGSDVTQVHIEGMSELQITELPENLEELYIPTQQCLVQNLPATIQRLRFDFPVAISSHLDPQQQNESANCYAKIRKFAEELPALQSLDLRHAPFPANFHTPNVPFLCCEALQFDHSQCTTKIVVGPDVRRVVIKNFANVESIEFHGEVERIGIQGFDKLKTLVVPASCKTLKVTECPQLAEVVFQGCTLDVIQFCEVDQLEILREEGGAVLPADIKSVLDECRQYPRNLPGLGQVFPFILGTAPLSWGDQPGV